MKTGTGHWRYAVLWVPGSIASECVLMALREGGRKSVWDTFQTGAWAHTPTMEEVLTNLYSGTLEFMERSTSTIR